MDLVAEYAATYGGAPRPDQPWHEVVALVDRARRFELRQRLIVADGMTWGRPTDAQHQGVRAMERAKLNRLAYPHDKDV